MEKKKQQCVYCLKISDDITKDHIFSRKWYPTTTLPTVERWVVPACNSCNNKFSLLEQELMVRMGLCLDPNSPESAGIRQKALNSINPKLGKNERDKHARQKLKERIIEDSFVTDDGVNGILPNFGIQEEWESNNKFLARTIPNELLEVLAKKFVRGLTYKLENSLLITPDNTIEIYHAEDNKIADVIEIIERKGCSEYRGPGVKIQRAIGCLESTGALFRITVWDRWTIYAVILPSKIIL